MKKEEKKLKKKRKKDEKKSKKKRKKDDKSKKKSKKSKNKKDSKKKKKKKKVSSSSDSSDDSSESDAHGNGEDVWVEKTDDDHFKRPEAVRSSKSKLSNEKDDGGDDESQVGPSIRNTSGLSHKDFGHALLPGEGAAMVS